MVEKIDRPDTKPIYEIREAKQTKEDQHQQQNPKEDMERRYQKELEQGSKEWEKFGKKTTVIKPVVVDRARITKLTLRNTTLFQGTGILQADVHWADGRKTEGVLVRLLRIEFYFQLKRLSAGQEVPDKYWTRGDKVELGIIQTIGSSGSFPVQKGPAESKQEIRVGKFDVLKGVGIVNRQTGETNWGIVAIYIFIATMILLGVFLGAR